MTNAKICGAARLDLTVWDCASEEEAHEVALEYIRQFDGNPWEDCEFSQWNKMGLREYCVRFIARAEALPRGQKQIMRARETS